MPTLNDIRRTLDKAGIDHRGCMSMKELEELYYNDASGYICPQRPGRPTMSIGGRFCRPLVYPGEAAPPRPKSAHAARRTHHPVKHDHCHKCHGLCKNRDECVVVGEKRYHAACCRCGACGTRLNGESGATEKDNELWCPGCASDAAAAAAPKCKRCREPVLRGVKVHGAAWHRECVRCALCDAHLVSLTSKRKHAKAPRGKDGRAYCASCLDEHFGQKCTSCGVPVLTIDKNKWTGEALCGECVDRAPCACCRSRCWDLIKLDDGRKQCVNCERETVDTLDDAEAIFRRVLAFFRDAHGLAAALDGAADLRRFNLVLVDRQRLKGMIGNGPHSARDRPAAVTVTTKPLAEIYENNGKRPAPRETLRSIALLQGMPTAACGSAIAHELCHAFLSSGSVVAAGERRLSAPLEEAACELWSALWLEAHVPKDGRGSLSRTLLDAMAKNRDPVYGTGYRECKKAFVALDRQKKKPPVERARHYHDLNDALLLSPRDIDSTLLEFMRKLRRAKALPGGFPREDPRSSGRLTTHADAAPKKRAQSAGHTRARHGAGKLF